MTDRERDYLVDTLENFELAQKDNKKDYDQHENWPDRFDDLVKDIQYQTAIHLLRSIIRTFDSMEKEQNLDDKTRESND